MGGGGGVDVLGDVEAGICGLVGGGRRVVLLEGPELKIQALERGKPKIVLGHVGGWMRI